MRSSTRSRPSPSSAARRRACGGEHPSSVDPRHFINLLFLTFTIRPQWSSLSLNERLLLAVAAEHVLIAAKIALDKLIPDVPAAMRKRTARLQYMATRAAQHGSVSSAASSAALLSRMNGVVAAPIQ